MVFSILDLHRDQLCYFESGTYILKCDIAAIYRTWTSAYVLARRTFGRPSIWSYGAEMYAEPRTPRPCTIYSTEP